MQAFLLTSQILRLVSRDPDAKKSPKGWKSTLRQLDRCPVKVLITAQKAMFCLQTLTGFAVILMIESRLYDDQDLRQRCNTKLHGLMSQCQPQGCVFVKAMMQQLCATDRQGPLACSKSHSLTVPPWAPATTTSSALSKETHSTGLWCPDKLCNTF